MSSKQIDYLNIVLMIFAFLVSIKLPFHLFLMAYAILGPLHYLTEIGWLDDKSYFSKNKNDVWVLVTLCTLVTIAFAINQFNNFEISKNWTEKIYRSQFRSLSYLILKYDKSFIFIAFYAAVMMAFVKDRAKRYGLMIAGIGIAYFINDFHIIFIIIGIMLPTVIHVYVFTGAFILFGALKSRSISGYSSLMVFVAILFLIFMQNPKPDDYLLTGYWMKTMSASNFGQINQLIAAFFNWNNGEFSIFSPLGIKMQIFMSFAYTYHYLNWFSKTKIINWHQVSKTRLYLAIVIWITSVSLYFYDYKIGFAALFFLSLMHVFFEFPLNHITFVGIFVEIKKRIVSFR